ncbi:hypothetical protein [Rhodopseudomonas sp.]|uniref:hypothetical protein n=1 Tax=Rhodopseudomonas sp. TaxID=1078 RepID=UPI0039E6A225
MSAKLAHVGEAATREMAEHGEVRDPVFERAAADAARSAGLSEADIIDMFGCDGMPSFTLEKYDLQRDPDESDDDYSLRRSLFK